AVALGIIFFILTKDTETWSISSKQLVNVPIPEDAASFFGSEAVDVFSGRVGHYVFTSSQSVYDAGQNLSEEDFDPRTHTFDSVAGKSEDYAEAKRQAEAEFFQAEGFPVTAVRFPIVIGIDDSTNRFLFHVRRVASLDEIYLPNPLAKISFVDSGDAAEALKFLGALGPQGPINVASEQPVELGAFVGLIEKALGKTAIFTQQETPDNLSPYGIRDHWYMTTSKLTSLGFSLRPIEEWVGPSAIQMLKENP
ncbi:MAG: NAD-dependent epimerase/dehydratase family protein, partial [Pseudomonadota bacterium]